DREPEHVRTRVVAHRVELAPGRPRLGGVDLGVQDLLAFGDRTGEQLATGRDDRRVAAAHPVVAVAVDVAAQLGRYVGAAQQRRHADDVDAALLGDVPQRGDPGVAVVPGRREVDVHALGGHGGPGQGHVVLPAGAAA